MPVPVGGQVLDEEGDHEKHPDQAGPDGNSHEGAAGNVDGGAGLRHAQKQVQAQNRGRGKQRIDRVVVSLLNVPVTESQQYCGERGRQSSPEDARNQKDDPDTGDGHRRGDRPGKKVGFPKSAVAIR